MKTKPTLQIAIASLAIGANLYADQLGPATICSGTARLDNGSLVTLGQAFVGAMSAANGATLNIGFLPAAQAGSGGVGVRPSLDSAPRLDASGLQLTISAQPGVRYVLAATTNLVNWVSLNTNVASGTTLTLLDPEATAHQYRFYRVRAE